MLWVAHKAVLHGQLISLATKKNRERLIDIRHLTKDLDHLYKMQHTPSQELSRQIQIKRQALDLILSVNTEKSLRFSKAKFMLHSNSPSAMFARKLNLEHKPPHVYKLKRPSGQPSHTPQGSFEYFHFLLQRPPF